MSTIWLVVLGAGILAALALALWAFSTLNSPKDAPVDEPAEE